MIIETISQMGLFALAILIFAGIGWLLLNWLPVKLSTPERYLIAISGGIVVWSLCSYLSAWIGLRPIFGYGLILVSIIGWWQYRKNQFPRARMPVPKWVLGLIVLGVAGQLYLTFPSGLLYQDGLRFYGVNAHDGMWHVALMQTLKQPFPAEMPTYAAQKLLGYHYLIDLTGSDLAWIFYLSPLWLVFRLFPLFFATMTGLTIYALIVRLTTSRVAAGIGIFLTYFGGSFGYMLPWFLPGRSWSESTFWTQQSITTFINLPLGASFAFTAIVLLLITIWVQEKFPMRVILFTALMTGMSVAIKAHGGLLLITAFVILMLGHNIKIKKYFQLGPLLIAVGLFSILTLNQLKPGTKSLIFEPGWFLKTMMEASDRVGNIEWELKRQTYVYQHNYPRLIEWWLKAGVIFLLGNLGIRTLGLLVIGRKRTSAMNYALGFSGIVALLGFLLPLLFLQNGIVWNTIQFFYYSLFMMNIALAIYLGTLKNKWLVSLASGAIVLLAIPTTIKTVSEYTKMYQSPRSYLSLNHDELAGLALLKDLPPGTVLSAYADNAFIPALTGKFTYFADETQAVLLGLEAKTRKQELNDIFCGAMNGANLKVFLAEKKIKYIYVTNYQADCQTKDFSQLPYLKVLMTADQVEVLQYD